MCSSVPFEPFSDSFWNRPIMIMFIAVMTICFQRRPPRRRQITPYHHTVLYLNLFHLAFLTARFRASVVRSHFFQAHLAAIACLSTRAQYSFIASASSFFNWFKLFIVLPRRITLTLAVFIVIPRNLRGRGIRKHPLRRS